MGSINNLPLEDNPLIAPWHCVSSNNNGMVICLLRSGIPCCSVRRFEGLALIDKILRVLWLFCLETNVKSSGYYFNMCFIGCLHINATIKFLYENWYTNSTFK